jgi:hypothetical protein
MRGGAFEVDQVVLLGQLHVVLHREPHRRHLRGALAQLTARILTAAGRVGMRHVRQAAVDRPRLGVDPVEVGLLRFLRFAELAPLFLAGVALGVVLRLADRLANDVGLPRQLFDLLLEGSALRLQGDEARHVGLHAAGVAVLLD